MDKKQLVLEFENTIKEAKLRSYQKVSLERPLSDLELEEFKALAKELRGIEV